MKNKEMIKTGDFDTEYCNHNDCYEKVIVQISGQQDKCPNCGNVIPLCETHFKQFLSELLPVMLLSIKQESWEGKKE